MNTFLSMGPTGHYVQGIAVRRESVHHSHASPYVDASAVVTRGAPFELPDAHNAARGTELNGAGHFDRLKGILSGVLRQAGILYQEVLMTWTIINSGSAVIFFRLIGFNDHSVLLLSRSFSPTSPIY